MTRHEESIVSMKRKRRAWVVSIALLFAMYVVGYFILAEHETRRWAGVGVWRSRRFTSPVLVQDYWPVGWMESQIRRQVVRLSSHGRGVLFCPGESPRSIVLH